MSNSDSVSTSPIKTSAVSVSYAESSSTKRKNGGRLNGIGENLPIEDESDRPEQKRSKVSPTAVAYTRGISLKQVKFPSHVHPNSTGGTDRAILVTISSDKAPVLRVAAKVLCNGTSVNRDTFSEALAAELNLLAQLSHPNISKLVGSEVDPKSGNIWVFSSWESNGNLSEFLVTGLWKIPERLSLIKDLLAGLKYLHTHDPPICHGNLKSRNVLVNSSSRAVVADFLSARLLRRSSKTVKRRTDGETVALRQLEFHAESTDSPQLEISHCGTRLSLVALGDYVRWEAPEVIFGMQPDFPCDIWAAGWICCEILTSKLPFSENQSAGFTSSEPSERSLPEIRATEKEHVDNLCRLMEACLALDPLKRPTIEHFEAKVQSMPSAVPTAPNGKIRSPALLCELGRTHYQLDNKDTACSLFSDALEIARLVSDDNLVAEALVGLGNVHRNLGRYGPAEESFSGARAIYIGKENELGEADAISGLAEVYRLQAKYVDAESFFKSALGIYSRFGNGLNVGATLRGLAHTYRVQFKLTEAEVTFIRARDSSARTGDELGRADALGGLGDVYRLKSMFEQAEECFSKAQDIYTCTGNNLGRADTFRGLGNVYRAKARYSEAERCFSQSRDIYFYLGNDRGRAGALRGLGNVYRVQSRYSEAEALFAEALDLSTRSGDDAGRAGAVRGLGNIFRVQGRYSEAADSFILAKDLYALVGDDQGQADAIGGLGDVHRGQGNYKKAEESYNQAYEIYTRINYDRGRADTLAGLGSVYDARSMHGRAADLFIEAQLIYDDIGNDLGRAEMLGLLGEMYMFLNMYAEAEESFASAGDVYTRLGNYSGREKALRRLDKVARIREEQGKASGSRSDDAEKNARTFGNETVSDSGGEESEEATQPPFGHPLNIESFILSMSSTPVNLNGHFCDVFEGFHSIKGKVALKRPRIAGAGYDDDVVRRFEREAATWRGLQHPHILEFLGTLKRDGHLYLVSPFINNGTLVEYVLRHSSVNRIRLLRETAEAVQYLHTKNIIHGDIKGTNILISGDAHALLCDFGLTKMIDSRTSTCVKGAGSVRWMSPELWENEPRSFESDVYAFGMTIAEVLTGNVPFPQLLTSMAVMMAVVGKNERPVKEPVSSPEGTSYEEAWNVAAACWPTKPVERIHIAEALRLLGTMHTEG